MVETPPDVRSRLDTLTTGDEITIKAVDETQYAPDDTQRSENTVEGTVSDVGPSVVDINGSEGKTYAVRILDAQARVSRIVYEAGGDRDGPEVGIVTNVIVHN